MLVSQFQLLEAVADFGILSIHVARDFDQFARGSVMLHGSNGQRETSQN